MRMEEIFLTGTETLKISVSVSLRIMFVRARSAEMYAVQVIIVLFSVIVKGIMRIFPVHLPVFCVRFSLRRVLCACFRCLENWLLALGPGVQRKMCRLSSPKGT